MRLRRIIVERVVGAGLAVTVTAMVALTATQADAAKVGTTLTQDAAAATATADRVDPGFFEPATLPDLSPHDPGEPGAGDVTAEAVAEPITIGATSTTGTPVTVGTSSLTLTQCEQAAPGLPCSTANFASRIELPEATALTNGATSAVVQSNDRAIRRMVVIDKSTDPTHYSFALTGGRFEKTEDAVVAVTTAGDVVGDVSEPWAMDANGAVVQTSYSVDENGILTLNVDHSGAAYPVVADPTVSFGVYIYVRYSEAETSRVYTHLTAYGLKAMAIFMCGLVGKVSGWIGAAACAATVGLYLNAVADTLKKAHQQNCRLELKFTYNGWLVGWKAYSCRS